MLVKQEAICEMKTILEKYRGRMIVCSNDAEKDELIDIVETLEWVVKDLEDSRAVIDDKQITFEELGKYERGRKR